MNDKIGRNDPCPCGSGKKYKQCCLGKTGKGGQRKLKAKWLNAPDGPNLIERTFGASIDSAVHKPYVPPSEEKTTEQEKSN